jgi:hypothetical protein
VGRGIPLGPHGVAGLGEHMPRRVGEERSERVITALAGLLGEVEAAA